MENLESKWEAKDVSGNTSVDKFLQLFNKLELFNPVNLNVLTLSSYVETMRTFASKYDVGNKVKQEMVFIHVSQSRQPVQRKEEMYGYALHSLNPRVQCGCKLM